MKCYLEPSLHLLGRHQLRWRGQCRRLCPFGCCVLCQWCPAVGGCCGHAAAEKTQKDSAMKSPTHSRVPPTVLWTFAGNA